MRPIQTTLIIFLVLLIQVITSIALATERSVRIIYVSNKPNIEPENNQGGYAELATFINSARENDPSTLFLHGGDSLGPSLLSSFDRGSHMIDILNALETNGMAVGQREFSYYEDELTLRTSEADFPILSANIFDPLSNGNLEGVISSYIYEANGLSIGVTAIVSEEVILNYLPKRISVLDVDQAVRKTSADLRSQGADLVVLMANHEPVASETWLDDSVVDLIIANSDADVNQDTFKTVNQRMLATKGWNLSGALDIKIALPAKGKPSPTEFVGQSVALSEYAPNTQVQQQIEQHLHVLSVLLDKELGVFGSEVITSRHFVRTQESQLGNLIADAFKLTFNVDVGFFNGGSIRGDRTYKKGDTITRKTLQQELPFRDSVSILLVTGEQILQALENGFSAIEDARGRFPQVSGIKVKVSPSAPAGQRVVSVLINNKPLNKNANYRLATTSFLAAGGDGYDSFKSAKRLQETVGEQIISDIVSEYILSKKVVSPKIEGRILQVKNQNTPSINQ